MKKVNTNKYTKVTLSLERINDIIKAFVSNGHRFLVLYHSDPDKRDYVQTTLEDDTLQDRSPYLIEARVYHTKDTFTHYPKIYAKVVDVLPFFEAFYQNTPLSYENWEDVTKEFLEN